MLNRTVRWLLVTLAASLIVPAAAQEGWHPYGFGTNEEYKYKLKWTKGGDTSTGHYGLTIRPADDGRLKVEVDGKLGEMECNATVTVESAEAVPQHMMMSCMMMAPALILFWGPSMGYWAGRELTDDDEWSFSQGDESMSFSVEGDCNHAGQTGKLAVMKQNGEIRTQSCLARTLALPIAVLINEEGGDSIEATLEKYRGSADSPQHTKPRPRS